MNASRMSRDARAIVAALVALALALASGCAGSQPAAPEAEPEAMTEIAPGVRIRHRVEGTGASPSPGSVVRVHYHGTFPDGKVFDSSVVRGEPATFPLNRVIPCWTSALPAMKVGGKAMLVCAPEAAYGARGAGNIIPPNATLYFDVELLEIVRP
jgi:FKBP-type peptidyl-prolyl cis-trans isomerase FkpA